MSDPQQDFNRADAKIADLMAGIEPPSDLRRRLMSLTPEKQRSVWSLWPMALASAALVVICLLTFPRGPSLERAQTDLSSFLASDFELSVTGEPLDRLRSWLEAQHVPTGSDLPKELAAITPAGCRVIDWNGRRASLICFPTTGGELVHLVIFEKGTFHGLPSSPQMAAKGTWNMASWRSAEADFLVFSKTDLESLQRFLG